MNDCITFVPFSKVSITHILVGEFFKILHRVYPNEVQITVPTFQPP